MILNEMNVIGMEIFVVIALVGVIYLGSVGILTYINMVLDRTTELNVMLKVDVLAFWLTVIPMAIILGWTGVISTIAFAYVLSEIKDRR